MCVCVCGWSSICVYTSIPVCVLKKIVQKVYVPACAVHLTLVTGKMFYASKRVVSVLNSVCMRARARVRAHGLARNVCAMR